MTHVCVTALLDLRIIFYLGTANPNIDAAVVAGGIYELLKNNNLPENFQ